MRYRESAVRPALPAPRGLLWEVIADLNEAAEVEMSDPDEYGEEEETLGNGGGDHRLA